MVNFSAVPRRKGRVKQRPATASAQPSQRNGHGLILAPPRLRASTPRASTPPHASPDLPTPLDRPLRYHHAATSLSSISLTSRCSSADRSSGRHSPYPGSLVPIAALRRGYLAPS
ncbi:hypothetical protein G7Z17_g10598 [Cylindrodendrum hubeiense]|uniref:Uncharacterized protein n=1 Tax=Cylindrodendrum hubeiense TaxID=595255 RepID=A0A9P5LC58_9HYPO|nr:hypothetical protein G7Z17_g10598 [Cylindrodendrum hubeiense]